MRGSKTSIRTRTSSDKSTLPAKSTKGKARSAETSRFKRPTLRKTNKPSPKISLSGPIPKPLQTDTWAIPSMEVSRRRTRMITQSTPKMTTQKTKCPITLSSLIRSTRRPLFPRRRSRSRRERKGSRTCWGRTTFCRTTSQQTIWGTTFSSFLTSPFSRATTRTGNPTETFSTCVMSLSILVESSDAEHGSRRKNSKYLYFAQKADDNKSICFS